MTHTPGPWRVTADGYIAGQGFVPIRTPYRENAFKDGPARSGHPEAEVQANARLIAAAPELLEALEACLDAIGSWEPEEDPYYVTMARAAIAKARENPRFELGE